MRVDLFYFDQSFFRKRVCKVLLCTVSVFTCLSAWVAETPARTKAEVSTLIDTEGATLPPWWNATKLTYPPTLLLHWERPQPKEPWTPDKYLGQHIWTTINENPGRWKQGARLLFHVAELNKDDAAKRVESQKALARIYQYLLQDYARAAYWWRQAGVEKEDADAALPLANCFFKLGNKDYPREVLSQIGVDETRHGDVIKLWADLGEYDKALAVARQKWQEDSNPDIGYLMAGETCRLAGRTREAIDFFEKAMQVDDKKAGRDVKQTKARAKASIEAVKLYDNFDPRKVADGTYTADSYGYSGQVKVGVSVKAGKIDAVKIVSHSEKQYYGALTDTPAKIIQKQSVKGIDAFTGATITSEAIINATAKALVKE
jgi:uncharacterized protein with FMN-binding domain